MLVFLEQQRSGAFPDHEAVTVRIERARGLLRLVVSGRKSLHGVESAHSRRIDGGFGASRQDHVRLAPADVVQRVDHRMVRRRAGRNGTEVGTPEAVFHRDVPGSQVGDHLRNEERAISRDKAALNIALYLLVERFQSTYSGAPDHSDHIAVDLLQIDARVLDGLFGSDERILRVQVVLAQLLAVEETGGVVAFELAGEFRFEVGRVEMSNGSCSAHTFLKVGEIFLNAVA